MESSATAGGRSRQAGVRPYIIVENLCVGCKVCLHCCHVDAVIDHIFDCEIDPDRCVGCGRCAHHCPNGAIVLPDSMD